MHEERWAVVDGENSVRFIIITSLHYHLSCLQEINRHGLGKRKWSQQSVRKSVPYRDTLGAARGMREIGGIKPLGSVQL